MTNTPNLQQTLQFKGTWRSYQARVLDRSKLYLQDKKMHIVAAPGSGKTTLGIELIRRLNQPCLILTPSIVIRQQWLARIEDAFMTAGTDANALLSPDIRKPAAITAITYQALHSAMTRYSGILEEDNEEDSEKDIREAAAYPDTDERAVDYSGFDLFQTVKEAGITTICLDECHHLKNEWWKALEDFMGQLKNVTIISLTATPPYDSTPAQWERYMNMCGPIDEEIIVPELVKEGSLCPHQDYVYFNYPTAEEKAVILDFQLKAKDTIQALMTDEEFARIIASHAGLSDPDAYNEQFLEYPAYLSSLLIFLTHKQIPFSSRLTDLLGTKKFPPMSAKWMEILLQGFLYDDCDSYSCTKQYRDALIKKLKTGHFIIRNKVTLTTDESLEKLLINSKGKMKSIVEIVRTEYASMGSQLRLLLLTDYIRKEYRSAIGNPAADISSLGVLPFFEMLRREQLPDLKLGILCGSLIVIPAAAVPRLKEISAEYEELKNKISYKAIVGIDGTPIGYSEVSISGKKHISTSLITQLFEEGYMHVLTGTKSLLGEGWDSPCINSLILASFVGSFVLSNQMRGRAIRVMKNNPDKTSNIWHLVCMNPDTTTDATSGTAADQLSEDFQMLERRMKGFLGLSYSENTIENGMERLDCITPPYHAKHIDEINQQMCEMSAQRETLKQRWNDALVVMDKMEVADQCEIPAAKLKPGAYFRNLRAKSLLYALVILLSFCALCLAIRAFKGGSLLSFFFFILMVAGMIGASKYGFKLLRIFYPMRRLDSIGKAVLYALKQSGAITSMGVKSRVEQTSDTVSYTYLKGGTTKEKEIYAECMEQFFAAVDNQRYLLYAPKCKDRMLRYFCIPDLFAKSKENAELLKRAVCKYIGDYELIYTRSPEGRQILLKARSEAFANQYGDASGSRLTATCSKRRKQVKSALE